MSSNTFMKVDEVAETLGISKSYIWLEGDKVYSYYPIVEGVPVTFEIINNTSD